MYEVNIGADPDHFLHWDKPISEQSQHVQDRIQQVMDANPDMAKSLNFQRDLWANRQQARGCIRRSAAPETRQPTAQSTRKPPQMCPSASATPAFPALNTSTPAAGMIAWATRPILSVVFDAEEPRNHAWNTALPGYWQALELRQPPWNRPTGALMSESTPATAAPAAAPAPAPAPAAAPDGSGALSVSEAGRVLRPAAAAGPAATGSAARDHQAQRQRRDQGCSSARHIARPAHIARQIARSGSSALQRSTVAMSSSRRSTGPWACPGARRRPASRRRMPARRAT